MHFFPAAILYGINYGRLGDKKKKWISIAVSFTAFLIFIGLVTVASQTMMRAFAMGINLAAGGYLMKEQMPRYNNHIFNGGKKASLILPVLISLVVVGFFIWARLYTINIPTTSLDFNGDKLYYTEAIGKTEAQRIGKLLVDRHFFEADDNNMAVKFDKKADIYVVSIMVDKEYVNDKEVTDAAKTFANHLSDQVFNKAKVKVYLCDNRFNKIRFEESD